MMNSAPGKTTLAAGKYDGRILLSFSDDDMEAYADFLPPTGKGVALTMDDVKTLLARVNVCHGVFWGAIEAALSECVKTGKPAQKILIARGDVPVNEVPAHYHLEDNVRKPARPKFEEGAQANYHAFSSFIIVQKDQVLARQFEAVAGVDGKTVHGVAVPFAKEERKPLSAGKNVVIAGGVIRAAIAGQFVISNNALIIEPKLVVKSAVGYATGDINFPGDVELAGPINDGFRVQAGGSLTVKDTLEATDIVVSGNMQVRGGMIGRGRGLVKVSGNLSARFIQNCRVACKKQVSVSAEIVNSTIYTMETVSGGDKGVLLGGEIFAIHSVTFGRIGKEQSLPVKIHLGSDWTLRSEIDANSNMLRLLNAKMEQVKSYLVEGNLDAEKTAKVEEMQARLTAEIEKCRAKKTSLEERSIVDRAAALVCFGTIVAGTIVEICGVEFIIEEPLKKTRIALDDESGRIAPRPL